MQAHKLLLFLLINGLTFIKSIEIEKKNKRREEVIHSKKDIHLW